MTDGAKFRDSKVPFSMSAGSGCYHMPSLRTAGHSIHNSIHIGQYICYAQCMSNNLLFDCTGLIICRHVILLSFDELSH